MSDSTTPGFLRPLSLPPPDDQDLDVVLQAWIVGLTGLPGNMVRPRWQPAPPPMPDQGVNWCGIGIMSIEPDANAWQGQDDAEPGTTTMQRHEMLDVLATFYGSAAARNANLVRDSAQIGQNRDLLTNAGIALVSTGTARIVPDLINQIWVRRADLSVSLRRQVSRIFPVRSLLSAPITAYTAQVDPALPPRAVLTGGVFLLPPGQAPGGPSNTAAGLVTFSVPLRAGADVPGQRVLMYDGSGGVILADPTVATYAFAGISLGAALAGTNVPVCDGGWIQDPSWAWTPGAALYVAPRGVLTVVPPATGILQQVATALRTDAINVQPYPPVTLL